MAQAAVLESTAEANGQSPATPERKQRKRYIAVKAISLQLGTPIAEIEAWCDRQNLEIVENSRSELEVDTETMEQFVRQWRTYQGSRQAELDIAILSQAQPVTISVEAAQELGLMSAQTETPKLEAQAEATEPAKGKRGGAKASSSSNSGFNLRGVKKAGNFEQTLRAVIMAQPDEEQSKALEALRSEGEEGVSFRKRIIESVYRGKGATDKGLLKAAQKMELTPAS